MSTFAPEERKKGFLPDEEKIFPFPKIFFDFVFIFDFKKIFKKMGIFPQNNLTILKKMFIILRHYQTLNSYNTTSFICETEKEANVLVTSLNLAETCETVNYVIAHIM